MNRLFSYAIYLIAIIFPVMPLSVIFFNIDSIFKGDPGSIFAAIFFGGGLGSYFLFFLRRSRRVYYKESSLYIYSLFSNRLIIINKDDIGSVEKLIFFNPSIWEIIYYDKNKDAKHIYFIRNALLGNFNAIVDELIS